MPKASPSTRAYEKATLSCGLVTVPISVYAGSTESGISRKWFTRDNHPVGYVTVNKDTGESVARADVVTKIETEAGFVYVEDHEIEALFDLTPKTVAIKSFQPLALFREGTYVGKTRYFVEATPLQVGKRKSPNKAGQQALGLVLAAMAEMDAMAFVEFTTRGVPKPAALLPDGSMWVLAFDEEQREQREQPELEFDDLLMHQGRQLVEMLWRDEAEDLTDHRTALIQQFADNKAKAGDFDESVETVVETPQAEAPSDLMALLTASLAANKAA